MGGGLDLLHFRVSFFGGFVLVQGSRGLGGGVEVRIDLIGGVTGQKGSMFMCLLLSGCLRLMRKKRTMTMTKIPSQNACCTYGHGPLKVDS